MKIHLVIPARYNSTRLPGKPLLRMNGHTMVYHVYQLALLVNADSVCVATDDDRVYDEVVRFGGKAVMTKVEHESGTDRLAEVADILNFHEEDIVINLQGDEPLLPPNLINNLSKELISRPEVDIATLACQIKSSADVFNPNVVKVVCDDNRLALYFSRAPIPWSRASFSSQNEINQVSESESSSYLRHIGLYAYKVSVLKKLSLAPPAKIEQIESLEQLRALSSGMSISVKVIDSAPPHGVDTFDDYERVRRILEN